MEKRTAILEAARTLFSSKNFAGTSMDAIAKRAGVSKLTVYSHFGDKNSLFREVLRSWMQEYLPESIYRLNPGMDLRTNLEQIAFKHVRAECNCESVGTLRAIISDSIKGEPRFGEMVWEEAMVRTNALLEGVFRQAVDSGLLVIDDIPRAVIQFLVLIKGDLKMRQLLGGDLSNEAFETQLEESVTAGVHTFLCAFQPRRIP